MFKIDGRPDVTEFVSACLLGCGALDDKVGHAGEDE
jgi:hypothetical protein